MLQDVQQIPITEADVRLANREVYNAKSPSEYERNASIFNPCQRRRILGVLAELRDRCGGTRFLDVGCGTGNLLRLASEVFPFAVGVDQADRLLAQVAREEPGQRLMAAQAHRLPFADGSFDVIGMYALLHHMLDPLPALEEAGRVLRPGGILYTDHDPNLHFGRFYHLWYRLKFRGRNGFGSAREDLAEYHNVFTGGLDPENLRRGLVNAGFSNVEVRYRHSLNPSLQGLEYAAHRVLRGATRVLPLRCFHTHFMLLAERSS